MAPPENTASPRVRMTIWFTSTVIVALLVVIAPSISDRENSKDLITLFASTELALASLVVLIAGNVDLITSHAPADRESYVAKMVVHSGSLVILLIGALIYARLVGLHEGTPDCRDKWSCFVLFFTCACTATSAVGLAAKGGS